MRRRLVGSADQLPSGDPLALGWVAGVEIWSHLIDAETQGRQRRQWRQWRQDRRTAVPSSLAGVQ